MSIIIDPVTGITNVVWTTAGRPSTPTVGQMGYNTTLSQLEVWNGTGWISASGSNIGATVTRVTGNGIVSGISLTGNVTTAGNLTLSGNLNLSSPPAIGTSTPNIGVFTNLSTTGNLVVNSVLTDKNGLPGNLGQILTSTGNGVQWQTPPANINLASPPPIGNAVPNTGSFTTLSVTSALTDSTGNVGTSGQFLISTGSGTQWITANVQMSSVGNVGNSNVVPGGPNLAVQYNSSGTFAGDSNLIWDPSNIALTISGTNSSIVVTEVVGTAGNSGNAGLLLRSGISTSSSGFAPGVNISATDGNGNAQGGGSIIINAGNSATTGGNVQIAAGAGVSGGGWLQLSGGNVNIAGNGNIMISSFTTGNANANASVVITSNVGGNILIGTVNANEKVYIGNLVLQTASNLSIGGGANGQVLTTDGNSNISWANQAPSIGQPPQTWQNVKANRAFNTNYINTTTLPIMVCVSTATILYGYPIMTVDGIKVGVVGGEYANQAWAGQLSAIVPVGSTYSVFGDVGDGFMISWAELR